MLLCVLRVKQRLLETLMMVHHHHHRPLSASLFHFIYIFSLVSCPFISSMSVVLFHVVENLYEEIVVIILTGGWWYYH